MAGSNLSEPLASDQRVRSCIAGVVVRSKRWLEVDGRFAIGEGGGELLAAIAEEGSLARAARRVGWSYRHAWGYMRRAEEVLGVPLLSPKAGKGSSRGMRITDQAKSVLETLRETRGVDARDLFRE
jgi:molybdate transport system regulatory protein